jgi:TonB-linked SusC/RagA family outer membrane protein
MRKLLLSLTLLFAAFGLMAQQKTITGVVSDNQGGLPQANVRIKGSTVQAAADWSGAYQISVSVGETLIFSFAGFETAEVKITASTSSPLNVVLNPPMLKGATVTAYAPPESIDQTGSTSLMDEDALRKAGPVISVESAMQGRTSGVSVTSGSGMPGEATAIRIRGTGSLTGDNNPLYVIDGMPIGGSSGGSSSSANSNPLASINPADIVSMEVLKDASATAIYGARAANGVIMITTRRGKAGDAKVSYEGNISVSQLQKKIAMMNLKEYADYRTSKEIIGNYGQPSIELTKPEFLGNGTDWQDELFRLALSHSHQLSFNGGTEKTTYSVSLGFGNQEGIITNTDFKRFNGRINLESKVKDWLTVGVNMAYTHINKNSLDKTTENDESIINQALIQLPTDPVKNIDGSWSGPSTENGAVLNPIASAIMSPVQRTEQNFLGNIYTGIDLFKGLNWRTEFGIDYSRADEEQFKPTYDFGTVNNTRSSMYRLDALNFYWRFSTYLNYTKKFEIIQDSIYHSFNAMGGFEADEYTYRGTTPSVIDLLSNNVPSLNLGKPNTIEEYQGDGATASAIFRAFYSYSNRYLLTVTGRWDGSSNFAPGNQWGFFPAFSFAWNIDNEAFYKRSSDNFKNVLSSVKFRAGYGQTGNQNTTPAHRGYLSVRTNTDGGTIITLNNYVNEHLKWERNWQVNVGLDLSFWKRRISATIDGYYKENIDLLLTPALPAYVAPSGWPNITVPDVNSGTIRNIGADLTISSINFESNPLENKHFNWTTDLTFSIVRNKVMDTGITEKLESTFRFLTTDQHPNRSVVGKAPGMFFGYKTNGVIKNTDQLNELKRETGTKVGDINFVDVNGDGAITDEDMTYIGDPNPLFNAGLGNTFSYGPWSLNIFVTASYGNDVYNMTRMKLEGMNDGYINQTKEVLDFAKIASETRQGADGKEYTYSWVINENTSVPRPDKNDDNGNAKKISDRYVEDGSYIRIQNISLSYSLPQRINEKLHISNLRVSGNVQNVYTFTNYSGYDPEVLSGGAISQGVDVGRYPSPRVYSLSVNFEF